MLSIHRAERADPLVAALADVLAVRFEDPFKSEIVCVPTKGIERWLSQQLSASLGTSPGPGRADGVCANIEFPFPGRLVGSAVADATGVDREADPWRPELAVWPLLEAVDTSLDEPWLAPLAGHLRSVAATATSAGGAAGAAPGGIDTPIKPDRRFTTVRHLADLFDQYGVHRPTMIDAWSRGDDTDAHGSPLPPDLLWQAELWRLLRGLIGMPSPAERLGAACTALRERPDVTDLPNRLSLFGLTRLATSYVEVLHALANHRDIHLFLLHPAPDLWERVSRARPEVSAPIRRVDDPTVQLPRNHLISTWARDAREMQLVLPGATRPPTVDHHHHGHQDDESIGEPSRLLARLQADVRADRPPPGEGILARHEHGGSSPKDQRMVLADDDRSIQVHSCHGRARQVEVVRDAVLHLLDGDPSLELRDIIVMCPDIDAFAPLIHAVFGSGEIESAEAADTATPRAGGLPSLTVRLADRSLRQTNSVLAALSELLSLADARLSVSQVIDFASRDPVRQRFRFDDDDVARIEGWMVTGGVRWAFDGAHRDPYQLSKVTSNTWRAGLDRLLLGVAMAEDGLRTLESTLPLDDVDSGDIELAGRLAEMMDRLIASLDEMQDAKPVAEWTQVIARSADRLFATDERNRWKRAQLARILEEVATEAGESATDLSLDEVRALLGDRLRGRPTRANFRTGHLTVCTLVPMRSVPHRVVCLLGLDSEVFPRRTAPDGDDLLQRVPCVGDRDPGSEDRQLLLDALLAAKDHLVITYSGFDERTNALRPPSVPLGELVDTIDLTARLAEGAPGGSVLDRVVVEHPLQPFDERNFTPGELGHPSAWSFDRVALAGARAAARDRLPRQRFLPEPLPYEPSEIIELDELVRFVQHPVKAFLRQRLGLSLRELREESFDSISVELDNLKRWEIGQHLVEACLTGVDGTTACAAEVARGSLPPGELGRELLAKVMPDVERIMEVVADLIGERVNRGSRTALVELSDGRSVVGTATGLVGSTCTSVTFSRLGPKQRLAMWTQLVALAATTDIGIDTGATGAGTGAPPVFRSVAIGRGNRGRAAVATIDPVPVTLAREQVELLVDLYDRGMCEPLPLFCKTSHAYALARIAGGDPTAKARAEWTTWPDDPWESEDRDLAHQLVFGGVAPFERVVLAALRDTEHGPGWGSEDTRFGQYAMRLWGGVFGHEKLEQL